MGIDNKPRVLVLGANGMLGHKLYQVLSQDNRISVKGTIRSKTSVYRHINMFGIGTILEDFEVTELGKIAGASVPAFQTTNGFDVIVNCVGNINKNSLAYDLIWVNSIFPQILKGLVAVTVEDVRLIHISTDCVFSGKDGNYTEDSPADATDAYGKTKWLGEIDGDNVLTIRTSIIGRELVRSRGLLEWFISQKGNVVDGYANAIFSGFPTVTFAGIIKDIILNHPHLNGLYHVASEPISKYTLLNLLNNKLELGISIDKKDCGVDRSLDGSKFNKATGFKPKPWPDMISELAVDCQQYEAWR